MTIYFVLPKGETKIALSLRGWFSFV